MSENIKIEPGKYFEIVYDLYRVNPDGTETLMHQVDAEEPDNAVFGASLGFVPALEKAVEGLGAGSTFDFYADPEEAFGPYDDNEVIKIERERFVVDDKFDSSVIRPGAMLPLMMSDGYRVDALVLAVDDREVTLDFNHPLAKDRVHYVGKVTVVREPTDEEIYVAQGGGCCGGCGSDDCGGCGGGCGGNCGC